jgi:hypothetical protein
MVLARQKVMKNSFSLKRISIDYQELILFLTTFILLVFLFMQTPNKLEQMREHFCLISLIGVVGFYRYGMWIAHLICALIYEHNVYADLKK